mgnify:CR=1 FL=1
MFVNHRATTEMYTHAVKDAYQLRLDQDSPGALQTGWAAVSVQPAKHTGYAVQWFVMALVLLLMTLIANSNLVEWLKQRSAN